MATGGQIGTIRGTIKIDYDGAGIMQAERDVEQLGRTGMKTSEKVSKLGTGLLTAGGVIAAGFGVAANAAVSFEKRMSAIAAVSGATQTELDKLSAKALQLGADTSFSASEAALAMEELVKAGLSVDDVLNGAADATVALAAAGEVELPEAAAIASNAMNQFGLAAKDLPKVADSIAGAANASAIDVREFGFSLAQVGAVANLAGQSFDDTATAIALMGNAGIKGSDAGTSLKTFLSNLIPTTDKATGVMEDLGIITEKTGNRFLDAQGNYKSLGEISGILQESLKGLSEGQKQVALETLFGSDAVRAAAIIAKEGSAGFNELNAAMHGTTAAEVAAKRLDNTAGSIDALKGSAETLAISIGKFMIPVLRDIVDFTTKVVNWFNSLDDSTKSTIVGILATVGGLALLAGGLIKIVTFGQKLIEVVRVIKLITAITKVWTAVQAAFNVVMSLNPIGLLIIAIAALIAGIILLWKNSETFRNIVLAVWGAIKAAVSAVVDWLVNTAWPWIQKVWDGIVAGLKWLLNIYISIWTAIGNAVLFVVNLFVSYVKLIISIWSKIIDFFKMLAGKVAGFFGDLRDKAIERIVNLINFVKSVPGKILDALGNVGKMLFNAGKSIIQGLIDGLKSMASSLWNTMTGMLSDLRDLLPFSPAKKGPFSGKGWTLFSGVAMVEDLAKGITRAAEIPVDSMTAALAGVQSTMPLAGSTATTAPASTVTNTTAATNIGTVVVRGVWDFTDPVGTRQMVGTLHDELDKYKKGYQ